MILILGHLTIRVGFEFVFSGHVNLKVGFKGKSWDIIGKT